MRHRVAGRKLNRTSSHRVAMRRNLVASLFEHETISTTMEKAKEVKPFAEKLITLAKKGTLAARRQVVSLLGNRDISEYEDDKQIRKGTIIGKLFSDIAPRYLDRPGGYTRIIRLSLHRLGDSSSLVLLQLVGKDEKPKKKSKPKKSAKKKAEVDKTTEADVQVESGRIEEAQEPESTEQMDSEDQVEKAQQEPDLQQDESVKDSAQTEEKDEGEENKE
ncbi:MAG: 50S ribosomal protein L17 [Planctomycetota bacterium]